jgi:hypothetical protein
MPPFSFLRWFHTVVEALLAELSTAGYAVPSGDGKALAMQWVRERWLYRDSGRGQETYQLTGDAKQAQEYVTRTTRTQLNVSASRIETMRRVISEAALAAMERRQLDGRLGAPEDVAAWIAFLLSDDVLG